MGDDTRTLEVVRSTSTAHRLTHYDGMCGNIHGHNMRWEVEAEVDMDQSGPDNMPLDLKDVSELIDETDHAILLNREEMGRLLDVFGSANVPPEKQERGELLEEFFGHVIWFEGDPTCEVIAQWMADRVANLDPVLQAQVTVYETDKYGIATSSNG